MGSFLPSFLIIKKIKYRNIFRFNILRDHRIRIIIYLFIRKMKFDVNILYFIDRNSPFLIILPYCLIPH